MKSAIGGYFELETNQQQHCYHPQAIALNTGRNALEYLLTVKRIHTIYLPYFTCDVLLEPVKKLNVPVQYYHIDEQLEPVFDFNVLKDDDAFLYTNYFGLKEDYIRKLSGQCKQLIVDNAQGFYAKPFNGEPTIYSARKFFGVADGAYLYCDEKPRHALEQDSSYDRMAHLLMRKDVSAEAGYPHFVANDKSLENNPVRTMSSLTAAILGSIDYKAVADKRIGNYRLLDDALQAGNQLSLKLGSNMVPMVYPYRTADTKLRQRLLNHKIYTATYWPNVKEWCTVEHLEYRLTDEIVYLPIDQRYSAAEMNTIIKLVLG